MLHKIILKSYTFTKPSKFGYILIKLADFKVTAACVYCILHTAASEILSQSEALKSESNFSQMVGGGLMLLSLIKIILYA